MLPSPLLRYAHEQPVVAAARIRLSDDVEAVAELAGRLRAARYPGGHDLHGLDRVWSRAELGVLITEAVNRERQLALGRVLPRAKGPRLDPRRLPDDRLEHLIRHHRDLELVEALRQERQRRTTMDARHAP